MIRRFVVLITMLVGALASIGYAQETSQTLFRGTVTGRFPECLFAAPNVYQQTVPNFDRGFYFLPAQLATPDGREGVYASWYTRDPVDPTKVNYVAGIWPLSAVKITQNNPTNFSVSFSFDATDGSGELVLPPPGIPIPSGTKLAGTCTRAPTRAPNFSLYFSEVQRGSGTNRDFFFVGQIVPGTNYYINQLVTFNGGKTRTSAFVTGTINGRPVDLPEFPKLIGEVDSFSGLNTLLIQVVARPQPAVKQGK
jgi:hypothetical protein